MWKAGPSPHEPNLAATRVSFNSIHPSFGSTLARKNRISFQVFLSITFGSRSWNRPWWNQADPKKTPFKPGSIGSGSGNVPAESGDENKLPAPPSGLLRCLWWGEGLKVSNLQSPSWNFIWSGPWCKACSPHRLADVFKQHVTQTHARSEVLATQVNVLMDIYTSVCHLDAFVFVCASNSSCHHLSNYIHLPTWSSIFENSRRVFLSWNRQAGRYKEREMKGGGGWWQESERERETEDERK